MRYGVFVWDADGDMGYGVIVGAFKTAADAEAKADEIRQRGQLVEDAQVECIVVPAMRGTTANHRIVDHVVG